MARLPRLTVPGYPHHIIQRGNNRQVIFADAEDFQNFLDGLKQHAAAQQVAVHSYVLMSNHLHLLVTPASAEGVPRMMQDIGRAYVRHFNRRHARSGTLWEGRYRSALVESERYLLACMAYIDLNPVRAGLVAAPADYPWSSHAHGIGLRADPVVTPHPLYWALGNTPFARELAYAALVQACATSDDRLDDIRRSVHGGWALGGKDFLQALQKSTPRRVMPSAPGRPHKTPVQK